MVAFAVRFATDFRDAGLSMAIVQRQTISAEQVSTIFLDSRCIQRFLVAFAGGVVAIFRSVLQRTETGQHHTVFLLFQFSLVEYRYNMSLFRIEI